MRHAAFVLAVLLACSVPVAAADPPAGPSPYRVSNPVPDATAQLAEMVALFDEICLKAFPDDAAVGRAMAARGSAATPMTPAEVRGFLHEDPGVGWHVAGRTAAFELTVEAPPFHACGLRTITAAGFPDLTPYKKLATAFEQGRPTEKVGPLTRTIGNVESTAGGEAWHRPDAHDESLFVFLSQPVEAVRVKGRDGVEVRFVHQIAQQPTQ